MRTFSGCSELSRRLPTSVGANVALIVGVAATLGCGKMGFCVEGLDLGTTYRVTVLEPADANAQYAVQTSRGPDFGMQVDIALTCGVGFDFVAGSTFLIEPVSKTDLNYCWGRAAIPSEVTEIELVSQMDGSVAGGGVMGTPGFQVDREGCTGRWQLEFNSPRQDPPLSTPVLGEYPPVLMRRDFTPSPDELQSCPSPIPGLSARTTCSDYFVVRLDTT